MEKKASSRKRPHPSTRLTRQEIALRLKQAVIDGALDPALPVLEQIPAAVAQQYGIPQSALGTKSSQGRTSASVEAKLRKKKSNPPDVVNVKRGEKGELPQSTETSEPSPVKGEHRTQTIEDLPPAAQEGAKWRGGNIMNVGDIDQVSPPATSLRSRIQRLGSSQRYLYSSPPQSLLDDLKSSITDLPEDARQAIWAYFFGPEPEDDRAYFKLEDALRTQIKRLSERDAESPTPAIRRFLDLYQSVAVQAESRMLVGPAIQMRLRVLRHQWEQAEDPQALGEALGEAVGALQEAGLTDEADRPAWVRQGITTAALKNIRLPTKGSGRYKESSPEKRRDDANRRQHKRRDSIREEEKKIQQQMAAGKKKIQTRDWRKWREEEAIVEARILDAALTSENPHTRKAAAKLKEQRNRKLSQKLA